MKSLLFIISSSVLVCSGVFVRYTNTTQAKDLPMQHSAIAWNTPNPSNTENRSSGMPGVTFSTPTSKPKLTAQQAEDIAKSDSPHAANVAKKIIIQYQLVTTDASIQNLHLHRLPCYIVSFEGLRITNHGGLGPTTIPSIHTEVNWLIDANTGRELFSYSFR